MGCMCCANEKKEYAEDDLDYEKKYSWDDKRKLFPNPENFIIENLEGKEEIRAPGSINGQQFIIQNCKNSTIYVFDYINTVTIDDCSNCTILLGPVQGSAFIRNCKSCICAVACGQFRMRDSSQIKVFLFSATQPIIEASSGIQFGTYELKYDKIEEHFEKTNLNCKNINWKVIYDFTPDSEKNWRFLQKSKMSDYLEEPKFDATKTELLKWGYAEGPMKLTQSESPINNSL